jgi:hypothetical protein
MPDVRRMGGFPQPWPSVRPRGAATASSRRLAPRKFDCAASLIFQIEKRPLRGISALQPGGPGDQCACLAWCREPHARGRISVGWQTGAFECGGGWTSPRVEYRTRHHPLAGLVFRLGSTHATQLVMTRPAVRCGKSRRVVSAARRGASDGTLSSVASSAAACAPALAIRFPRRPAFRPRCGRMCSISSMYLWRRSRFAGIITLPPTMRG